jgi:hypothetical protein
MTLTERYDGKEKKIVFSMSVANAAGTVNSQPLLLCVGPVIIHPKPVLLVAAGLPVLILVVLLLVRGIHSSRPDPPPVVVKKVPDTVASFVPMVMGGDPLRRMEDSLNADRQKKMRMAQVERDREDSLRRAEKARAKPPKQIVANLPPPPPDTPRVRMPDEAAIQRERRRQRLMLEKRVMDSVSVVDTVVTNKVLAVFRNGVRKLGIKNRSGYFLDTVVVEITPGGGQPYRKDFINIKARGFTVVMDKLSKKESLQAAVVSVIF